MKSASIRIKLHYYLWTLVLVIVLFIIEGARPTHFVLDSPLIYGYFGHTLLLIITFAISMYMGITNTYKKWLYPVCVVLFMQLCHMLRLYLLIKLQLRNIFFPPDFYFLAFSLFFFLI